MSWLYDPPNNSLRSFRITAQAMVGTQRIQKTVSATSDREALRLVSQELLDASFYAVDIREAG